MADKQVCDICEETLPEGEYLEGCEVCGRLYGPCCNSVEWNVCMECRE